MSDRLPPSHNLDAERAVLAAVLLETRHLRDAEGLLTVSDFFDPDHRAIWAAMLEIQESGGIPDAVAVLQHIRASGKDLPGSYLVELLNEVPAVANVIGHAEIVAGHARVRRIERTAQLIAAQARGGITDVDGWAQESARQMTEACASTSKVATVLSVKDLLRTAAADAVAGKAQEFCTSIHWKLDDATGGLRPGHVWVMGAETNWGKSSYVVALADENIKRGKRVLIVSAEDAESLYGNRLMARRARVNFSRLRDRRLRFDETDRVMNVAKEGESLPLYVDARGREIESVCRQIEGLIFEHRIDLVCFDYLQEFRSRERFQDERVKFREIAAQMRNVIKGANITGVILSQITVSETKKTPDKHSIRECRDVSNAAEVVILGFTPEADILDKDRNVKAPAGVRCIKVDKSKDGYKGNVEMSWDDKSACFNATEKPEEQDDYVPWATRP